MLRFYAGNKVNTKAKWDGEQNIVEYILDAILRHVIKARAEIERDEIEVQAKLRVNTADAEWENGSADGSNKITAEDGGEDDAVGAASFQTKIGQHERKNRQ
jgi:hypothetical protein